MHFQKVNKGIWPLIFIVGLFKITGIESVENQKGKQDVSADYDYEGSDVPNGEVATPSTKTNPIPTIHPFFEKPVKVVYASQEGENVTIKCTPKQFNEALHLIMWYRDNITITNGNTTLAGNFDIDNNHSLTIYNYTSQTPGNFSCHVQPGDITQEVRIVFKAPDNIAEHNAAAAVKYLNIMGAMALSLIITVIASTTTTY